MLCSHATCSYRKSVRWVLLGGEVSVSEVCGVWQNRGVAYMYWLGITVVSDDKISDVINGAINPTDIQFKIENND